jgi:hypothetical protein
MIRDGAQRKDIGLGAGVAVGERFRCKVDLGRVGEVVVEVPGAGSGGDG